MLRSGTMRIAARFGHMALAFCLAVACGQPQGPAPAQQAGEVQLQQKQIDVNGQLLEQIRGQNRDFNEFQRKNYRSLLENSTKGVAPSEAFK